MPTRHFTLLIAALLLAGCATTQTAPSPRDPFERMNRGVYRFNDTMDRAFLKPTAKGYRAVVPSVARRGIGNALSNLAYTTTLVNDVLQLKLDHAVEDVVRLLVNTTVGIAGLWDPASKMGIPRNDEDFGQTLGRWGVPSGPYIMLPFLGPSTVRDTPGVAVDMFTDGSHYIEEDKVRLSLLGLEVIDRRVELLALDATLASTYDPYAFVRNAYLQRREYKIKDGEVAEEEPLVDPESMEDEAPPAEEPATEPAVTDAPAAATTAANP